MAAQGFPKYRDRYSSMSSGLPVLAGDDVGGLGGQLRLGRVGNAGGPVGVGGVEGLGPEQGLDEGVEPVPVGPQGGQGLVVTLVEDAAGLGLDQLPGGRGGAV